VRLVDPRPIALRARDFTHLARGDRLARSRNILDASHTTELAAHFGRGYLIACLQVYTKRPLCKQSAVKTERLLRCFRHPRPTHQTL
jgi:hypothetical protein